MSVLSARPRRRPGTIAGAALAVGALAAGLLSAESASAVTAPSSVTPSLTSFSAWQTHLDGYDYALTTKGGQPALRFSNADGGYGNISQLSGPAITEVGEAGNTGATKRVFTADFTIDADDYAAHPGLAIEVAGDKGGNRSGGNVVFRQDEAGKLTITTYWADAGSAAELEDWNNDTEQVTFSGPVAIRYVAEYNPGAPDSVKVYANGVLAVQGQGFEAYHDSVPSPKQTIDSLLFRTNTRVPVEGGAWETEEPTTEQRDAVRGHGFYFSKISYGAQNVAFAPSAAIAVAATISGTPVVGGTLTSDVSSSAVGASYSYQWQRAGLSIAGATGPTYTATANDGGRVLTLKVTATKSGYTTGSVTTAATAAVGTATLAWTTAPTVTGILGLAHTLTVNASTTTSGVSYAYQWYRNGAVIKGATAKTYKLSASDVGAAVTVKVKAAKAGYGPLSVTIAVGDIAPGQLPAATLKVSGSYTVGGKVAATQTGWATSVLVKYAWYADGELIQLSASRTLVLTYLEKGAKISVVAIGNRLGYEAAETVETTPRGPVK